MVKTKPAIAKYIPFLKIFDLGTNIKKDETAKNNNETPKKIFKKNNGSLDVALCK